MTRLPSSSHARPQFRVIEGGRQENATRRDLYPVERRSVKTEPKPSPHPRPTPPYFRPAA